MAIGSDPSALEISGEFESSGSRGTGYSDYDLAEMHNKIIGSGDHNRQDFVGYGQPDFINDFNASTRQDTDSGGWVTFTFTVGNNNLPTRVRIEYHEDDGNMPFTGQSTIIEPPETYQSSGSKTLDLQLPSAGTLYQFRARHYNEFNEVLGDHRLSSASSATTSEPEPDEDPVNVTNIQLINSSPGVFYEHTWEYTETGQTSFQLEHQWDFDGWESGNLSNLSSSGNNYQGTFTPNQIDAGNEIQFRIRGDSSEGWNYTDKYPNFQ